MAPQAKKKLRYRLDDAVSNPVPHGTPVVQPWDFFFFFWRGDPKPGSPLFFLKKKILGDLKPDHPPARAMLGSSVSPHFAAP